MAKTRNYRKNRRHSRKHRRSSRRQQRGGEVISFKPQTMAQLSEFLTNGDGRACSRMQMEGLGALRGQIGYIGAITPENRAEREALSMEWYINGAKAIGQLTINNDNIKGYELMCV